MTTTNPSRILVVGDTHGDTGQLFAVIDRAVKWKADLILQVGDFGYWPRTPSGPKFLRKIEARLALHGLELLWIDGNHEDFDKLLALPIQDDGRRRISDHVFHLPRGFRTIWGNGTRWLFCGGAVSVDAYGRRVRDSWFKEEALTDSEVMAIMGDGQADVLVSHDAPFGGVKMMYRLAQDLPIEERSTFWPSDLIAASEQHQKRVRWLVDETGVRTVYHGHYHGRISDTMETAHGPVRVEGLGHDQTSLKERCVLVDGDGQVIHE